MPGRIPLGQHFLGSARLASRLVADAGVAPGHRVVDVGAGTGVLTEALAAAGAAVLAIEIDAALAIGLARKFEAAPNVTVLRADARAVPLPLNPFRVVANPPFGHTAAILHRLLDDPAGGLVRADVVVQWQVARHRARVSAGTPVDLLGAVWAPWWRFTRGRRLPAASFRPRPAVDAAVLTIDRRDPPELEPAEFEHFAAFVRSHWDTDAAERPAPRWVRGYRRAEAGARPGLHSRPESANMG